MVKAYKFWLQFGLNFSVVSSYSHQRALTKRHLRLTVWNLKNGIETCGMSHIRYCSATLYLLRVSNKFSPHLKEKTKPQFIENGTLNHILLCPTMLMPVHFPAHSSAPPFFHNSTEVTLAKANCCFTICKPTVSFVLSAFPLALIFAP